MVTLIRLSSGAEGGLSVPDMHGRWASEQTGVLLRKRKIQWMVGLVNFDTFTL